LSVNLNTGHDLFKRYVDDNHTLLFGSKKCFVIPLLNVMKLSQSYLPEICLYLLFLSYWFPIF